MRIKKKGPIPTSLSVVPLLLAEEEIPAEAREALLENRLQDAAELLMQEYGLSCIEASDLLDVSVCEQANEAGALFMHRIWRSISTRKAFRQVT